MLPNLPNQYKRKEAKIDSLVLDWFYDNYPNNVLVEVKVKGGRVTEKQKTLIKQIEREKKFKYKFPDMGRATPLDGVVVVKDLEPFLVICDGYNCVAKNKYREFTFYIGKRKTP